MVYCANCGTKNPDDARICAQCGEPLYFEEPSRPPQRSSDLCYDWDETTGQRRLSQRGILIIGAVITLWAIHSVLEAWAPQDVAKVWPAIIFGIGLLVIFYALFLYGRDRS